MPGPESPPSEAVEAHLSGCAPCRTEAEALREVDQRLQRLGAYQGLSVAELALRLDRDAVDDRGAPIVVSSPGARRSRSPAWLPGRGALLLLVLILCMCAGLSGGLWLLRRPATSLRPATGAGRAPAPVPAAAAPRSPAASP